MATVTVTLGPRTGRIVRMLAPRPWESGAELITLTPRARGFLAVVDVRYADRLAAQLSAAGEYATVRRLRRAVADSIADAAERRSDPNGRTYRERLELEVDASTGRAACPHPFRDGCPDGPWTCMTCGHREQGTCTSDHGPDSR